MRHYQIARCLQCGLEFNASFLGGGEDGETFDQHYFLVDHRSAFAPYLHDYRRDPSLPVFEHRLAQIESQIPAGSVLDVGPGLGTFLRLARERGWKTQAVDISHFTARHIRERHAIDVFR